MAGLKRGTKIAEAIAQDILTRICESGLETGSQLPSEPQMLADYGVGRGSLREALRILEIHGIIKIKSGPGGGPVVTGATTKDFGRMATLFFQASGITFRELMDARLVLEPAIARLAAQRTQKDKREELLEAQTSTESDEAYLKTSADFHRQIASMSGNRILDLISHAIEDIFHERVVGMLFPPERRGDVVAAHDAIARAIADGDADTAEQAMRDHMAEYARFVEARYPALVDEVVAWH